MVLIKNDWIELSNQWDFRLSLHLFGYDDNRPQLATQATSLLSILILPALLLLTGAGLWLWALALFLCFFGWGSLFISLPTRKSVEEMYSLDVPAYGIYYHDRALWIQQGKEVKSIDLPFQMVHIRHSILSAESGPPTGNPMEKPVWLHSIPGNRMDFYSECYEDAIWKARLPYWYVLRSGEVQKSVATITVQEREWRWRIFRYIPWGATTRRVIDVMFSEEMGPKRGSWKGGVIGCSWDLKPGETPQQALKRMEKERRFWE